MPTFKAPRANGVLSYTALCTYCCKTTGNKHIYISLRVCDCIYNVRIGNTPHINVNRVAYPATAELKFRKAVISRVILFKSNQ